MRRAPITVHIDVPPDPVWGRAGGRIDAPADDERSACAAIRRLADIVPSDATWVVLRDG